jgi:hypothetical protein
MGARRISDYDVQLHHLAVCSEDEGEVFWWVKAIRQTGPVLLILAAITIYSCELPSEEGPQTAFL